MNYVTNGDQSVVLGSGDLYAVAVSDIADLFNLTTTEEEKLTYLGYIEANAVLKSSVEKADIKAANAGKVGSVTKDKTITFATGIFSWNLSNVSKFLTGSDCTVDEATGKTVFTYAHEDNAPNVYLRFVSTDEKAKKKITVNMLSCSFNSDLSFDFNNDKPITFDYAFDVLSQKNSAGKHVYYQVITETIA